MINFSVGPVLMDEEIINVAGQNAPYFRTDEFSSVMKENERLIKKFLYASDSSRVITITGSGTAAMDAAVCNLITKNDSVLVVNGGTFGNRFYEICNFYHLNVDQIKIEFGQTIDLDDLKKCIGRYSVLLINMDETSSGNLYDIKSIGELCYKNNVFLIVDSISSFLCDKFNMEQMHVNCVLTGSQKALALHPGLSLICLDETAIERAYNNDSKSYYLDLKKYLKDGERGQTPFTPAVNIIYQLNKRLGSIDANGGVEIEIEKTKKRAEYFRERIKKYPFDAFVTSKSDAVTCLKLKNNKQNAKEIFETLKNEFSIFICPCGGDKAAEYLRVGHIGNLTDKDYDDLFNAFDILVSRGIL